MVMQILSYTISDGTTGIHFLSDLKHACTLGLLSLYRPHPFTFTGFGRGYLTSSGFVKNGFYNLISHFSCCFWVMCESKKGKMITEAQFKNPEI